MQIEKEMMQNEKPRFNQKILEFFRRIFIKKQSNSELNKTAVSEPNFN